MDIQTKAIQWFPGHMAKTRRMMAEFLPKVDIVIELLDARIPYSSKNPDIEKMIGDKPRVICLTKATLASDALNRRWISHYKSHGTRAVLIDSLTGLGIKELQAAVREALSEKLAKYGEKGMAGRAIKAMIVGIPNVGKSSLINRLAGAKRTKVEDRPGVTLDKQWVSTDIGINLVDMPGVLWPKFEDERVGQNLAITGAIRDKILDTEELAMILCQRLWDTARSEFAARYKLSESDEYTDGYEIFEAVARKRGFLMAGGAINGERCATMLLDEFRGGKIGRVTLDTPDGQVE